MSLFDPKPLAVKGRRSTRDYARPLAGSMRPERLEDFAGQEHILANGKPLRERIEQDRLSSVIFWRSPGMGKTTLARISAAARQRSMR